MRYKTREVADAAGVPITTLRSWFRRGLAPVGLCPDMSLLDAVRVCVMADMTRIGIAAKIAGKAARLVTKESIKPLDISRWAIVIDRQMILLEEIKLEDSRMLSAFAFVDVARVAARFRYIMGE